jgi:macrolide transport system ATP-binding/permease protein
LSAPAQIEISGVKKTYKMGDTLVRALDGVDLRIDQGEFVAIMGPSGSGKSTLMHILGLLDVPDEGSYKLFGEEVSLLSEDALAERRSRSIGFVFQQFNLLARTSAQENVALPMLYAEGRLDYGRAQDLLTQVGLGTRGHHRPSELSGGQQQRVAIARALTNCPRIIFADEPTGNLDSASEKEIMALLTELNRQGITIILVTHEPEIAQYVKRVIRVRDGKIQSDERRDHSSSPGIKITATPAKKTKVMSPTATMAAHLRQAFRALLANKIRTILSMLGILIGVAAVIAMLALGAGAQESIEKQLSSLGSNLLVLRPGGSRMGGVSLGAGATTKLGIEDAESVKNVPGVKFTSPNVNGRGQAVHRERNWSTSILGAGIRYAEMRAAVPVIGRFFTEQEVQQRARVAVIGTTVVRELFGSDANPIGENIMINRVNFQVIGVLPVRGSNGWQDLDDLIVIPVSTAMRRLLGKLYLDSVDIEVVQGADMEKVQEDILSMMNARHRIRNEDEDAYQIRNLADIQEALSATSRIMSILLASIASISLLVGGIGIMNIMLVSVTERTREIGLRKALGATRTSIQTQFLVESAVVSALGGVLGIGLGVGMSVILSRVAGWSVKISSDAVLGSALFSAIIGIVFGFWPARKASALHPIQALRHE